MKKRIAIVIILLIILSFCTSYYLIKFHGKLKICPDAWIDNQMPCACISAIDCSNCDNSQYLIIDHERRELSEFNILWIKSNCEVNKPFPVF